MWSNDFAIYQQWSKFAASFGHAKYKMAFRFGEAKPPDTRTLPLGLPLLSPPQGPVIEGGSKKQAVKRICQWNQEDRRNVKKCEHYRESKALCDIFTWTILRHNKYFMFKYSMTVLIIQRSTRPLCKHDVIKMCSIARNRISVVHFQVLDRSQNYKIFNVRATVLAFRNIHCVSKKQDTKLLPITSPNFNRFSKFFHWLTQW